MTNKNTGVLMAEIRNHWHLERKVTIGIIFGLLLNAGSSVWWASRLDYTVQNHETRIVTAEKELSAIKVQGSQISERLARMEENQKYQTEIMKEVKEKLGSVR
jgi:hypothetical protein